MSYIFHTKPYKHQKRALLSSLTNGSIAYLMDPGCGKTKPAIDYIGCRYVMGDANKALIIAPKTVLGVWEEEIQTHLPPQIKRTVVRLEGASRFKKLAQPIKGLTIFLISYDSTWRTSKELLKLKPDIVICDESHYIANPNSRRSRFILKLPKVSKWRLILTGTFLPNNILGAYSQMRFVDPKIFDMKWSTFKERYAKWYKPSGKTFKIFKGPKRVKELRSIVSRHSIKVSKDDALDLPSRKDIIIPVEMSPKGKATYNKMKKDKLLKYRKGKARANILLTELLYFQQITGGFVRVETGEYDKNDNPIKVDQFVHSSKLNALNELIDIHREYGEKIIIFCRFTWEFDRICELLRKKKVPFAQLSGKTKDRDKIRQDFQKGLYDAMVIQIATGGVGITLTAANIVIFYSKDQQLDHYIQARERVHRPGQKKKVIYYHLIVRGTIDEVIMKTHQQKKSLADMVTSQRLEDLI